MKSRRLEVQGYIGAAVIVAAVVALVYALIGTMDVWALRWWATLATLALPVTAIITWRLATNAAREHLRGHERGVNDAEKTLQSVGRGLSSAAGLAHSARHAPQPTRHDDLLPDVGRMKIVDAPQSNGEVIDL